MALSPDGRVLATANARGFQLWDVATGKEIFQRRRRSRADAFPDFATIESVAFLPHGRAIATGTYDGTILIWDVSRAVEKTRPAARSLDRSDLAALWVVCDALILF